MTAVALCHVRLSSIAPGDLLGRQQIGALTLQRADN
jgi:hypothetical protein